MVRGVDGIVYVDGVVLDAGEEVFLVDHEANVDGEVEEAEGSGWDVVGHVGGGMRG